MYADVEPVHEGAAVLGAYGCYTIIYFSEVRIPAHRRTTI
jgi:hypothetical protein